MKERPILFSGAMVRAILEGRKTQTRRVMRVQPIDILPMRGELQGKAWATLLEQGTTPEENRGKVIRCRYGVPGDHLWVRETWGSAHKEHREGYGVWYYADGEPAFSTGPLWKKRPAIHMPRWASRITLEVVSVRVERLRKITRKDAVAEGTWSVQAFQELWDKIHGENYPWQTNPWVWVVEFKKLTENQ